MCEEVHGKDYSGLKGSVAQESERFESGDLEDSVESAVITSIGPVDSMIRFLEEVYSSMNQIASQIVPYLPV